MSLFNNKKGLDLMHSTIIFIVLNLIFFLAMFAFVARTGSNAALYEQMYAKEIVLAIDQARPGTTISINVENSRELFEKNLAESVKISNGEVKISLKKGAKGYSVKYFSDYTIDRTFNEIDGNLFLKIQVEE